MPTDAAPYRCFIDLTTSLRWRRGTPVGLSRVELALAESCLTSTPDGVGFCRYDRRSDSFLPVPLSTVRSLITPLEPGAVRSDRRETRFPHLRQAGRALERSVRRSVRAPIRAAGGLLRQPLDLRPGDVVILGGDTWSQVSLATLTRLHRQRGVRVVILCHDLIPILFPHFYPELAERQRYADFIDFSLAEAAAIFCSSQSTMDDLLSYAARTGRQAAGEVRRLTLGATLPAQPSAEKPPGLAHLPDDFVLSVGTLQLRKNHQLLYAVWRRLLERGVANVPALAIAGRIGLGVDTLIYLLREDPLVAPHVFVLERATDRELAWLYAHCRFTVYPSVYEGWGLPIVESLTFGKYCLASATSSMPEAGQGLVGHLDPLDFAAWYRAIERLIADPAALAEREAAIRRRASLVTWEDCCRDLLAQIDEVARGHRRGRAALSDESMADAPRA